MNMVKQIIAIISIIVFLATGCSQSKPGPGIQLEKQLDTIVAKTGITHAYEIKIYVDYLVVTATYQGRTQDLKIENGELEVVEITDQPDRRLRGSLPLSTFDTQNLINWYRELKGSNECGTPIVYDEATLPGKHVLEANCFAPRHKYLPGSTTVDGQPVVDSPNPFNPEHVLSLALAHAAVLPDDGAITSWTITSAPEIDGTTQDAYAPRATTIFGTTCTPTLGTHLATYADGDFLAPPTRLWCEEKSESDAPADPNAPKPPTFRLSDYDPNLVNIAAQHIKEESGIDITQPMPIGYLTFAPANDGTRNLAWTFESAGAIGLNKVTGTLTPIT